MDIDRWISGFPSAGTRQQYHSDLARFGTDRFNSLMLGTREDAFRLLTDWKAEMIAKGLSPSYISRSLATLRSALTFFHDTGVLGWYPPKVKGLKPVLIRDCRGPDAATLTAIWSIINRSGEEWRGVRDRCLFRLLVEAGLRRNEITGLRVADIQTPGLPICLSICAKGGGRRSIPVTAACAADIQRWLLICGNSGADTLFGLSPSGLRHVVKGWGLPLGIRLHPHAFRHSAVTLAADQFGVLAARTFIGHSNISTTQRYMDIRDEGALRLEVSQFISSAITKGEAVTLRAVA